MKTLFKETVGQAVTTAQYDKGTRVLVVDQHAVAPGNGPTAGGPAIKEDPAPRRILETHDTRTAALRRAIALADEWNAVVQQAVE
jgi:hypothetical protein